MSRSTHQDLDDLIREALDEDERRFFDQLEEPGLHERMMQLLRGRNSWLTWVSMTVVTVFFALGIYCAVRFFQADDTKDLLFWQSAFFFSMMATMANKLWTWMELQTHSTLRELKRLELQVAHLTARLQERQEPAPTVE